jgi:small subunit ribosomal protein S3e
MQVKIMRPHDSSGKSGPRKPLPDVVTIREPKEEEAPVDKAFAKEEAEVY